MSERVNETVTGVKEQAASIAHTVMDQAAKRAASGAEHARDAASQAKGKLPGVTSKVNEDVVPSVREVALQAASAALELWQAARERAEEAVEAAQHEVAEPAAHAVGSAERKARLAASQVAERSEEIGAKAKEATKHAADATVSTGKDTGAALFWAGAAAGIVFYALLDQDRREQVLKTVDAVINQTRELIRDFQGQDEEFI